MANLESRWIKYRTSIEILAWEEKEFPVVASHCRKAKNPSWISPRSLFWLLLGSLSNDGDGQRRQATTTTKNNWFLRAKWQLWTCITLFSTFLWRASTATVKILRRRFIEDANIRWRIFLFLFEPRLKYLRIQLQEKWPTFDRLAGFNRRAKVWKDPNLVFWWSFHLRRRCLAPYFEVEPARRLF